MRITDYAKVSVISMQRAQLLYSVSFPTVT